MAENPLHIVSAWVSENQMTLAQTMVADKSNEITAIPQLLEILDLRIVMGALRSDGVDYGKKRVSLKRRMLHAIHDEAYLDSLLRRL